MKLSWLFFVGSIGLFSVGLAEAKEEHSGRTVKGDHPAKHASRHESKHHSRRHESKRRDHAHRDRGHKRYRDKYERRNRRHRDYNHHDYAHHRNDRKYKRKYKRERYRNRRDRDYFIGGAIAGSLAYHAFHEHTEYCPDDHYYDRKRRRNFYYKSNRHGECFRVERRRKGDVYIEVPRHKCGY